MAYVRIPYSLIIFLYYLFSTAAVNKQCESHLKYKQESISIGMHIICAVPFNQGVTINGILNAFKNITFHYDRDSGDIQNVLNRMYDLYGTTNNRHVKSKYHSIYFFNFFFTNLIIISLVY